MKITHLIIISLAITILADNLAIAQNCGCTDPVATNYDTSVVVNDGSCQYANSTITPTKNGELSSTLDGTSSLIYWDGNYWSCNDHTKLQLYRIDTLTAAITDSLLISATTPQDMEEVDQDSNYLYFGDFGNNSNTRTNLHILRVEKSSLKNGTPLIDTIFFSYPDQTDFTSSSMQSDFDCEAFIVGDEKIYLFTKQWTSHATVCYELPKLPGTYIAGKRDSCNVQGLITGATFFENDNLIVLCGYSTMLQPFIYLLYDYSDDNFFSGNKRKIEIGLFGSQIEAIASCNSVDYYLTNEKFTLSSISIPASLYHINLNDYLSNYLYGETPSNINNNLMADDYCIKVYPNPAFARINIADPARKVKNVTLYDTNGHEILSSNTEHSDIHAININQVKEGTYILIMQLSDGELVKEKIIIK